MTPEEFLETKGICSETTIGIEGDIPLTELLLEYANQAFSQPPVIKSVCDCNKWHDRMEESNNNCCTCDKPIK